MLKLDETLARSDGDEFVIMSPELDTPEAAAERVRDLLTRVAGPVSIEGFELPPNLVAGVVVPEIDPGARPRGSAARRKRRDVPCRFRRHRGRRLR